MGDILNMDDLVISSSTREYLVKFKAFNCTDLLQNDANVYLIDENVMNLHNEKFEKLPRNRCIVFNSIEDNKELSGVDYVIRRLLALNANRKTTLVCIGGGIIQDIGCFVAQIFMRGISWIFYPTTLLSQADSCIGSKSSINFSNIKNLIGSFYAPFQIVIDVTFLNTLPEYEIESGIGEIYKINLISGVGLDKKLLINKNIPENDIVEIIKTALQQKKAIIEKDEFDTSSRLVMNYGHTIGHALEIASNHRIPHGIAVSIGLNTANFLGKIYSNSIYYDKYNAIIRPKEEKAYLDFVDFELFKNAFKADKKHTKKDFCIIFPVNNKVSINYISKNTEIINEIVDFLKGSN